MTRYRHDITLLWLLLFAVPGPMAAAQGRVRDSVGEGSRKIYIDRPADTSLRVYLQRREEERRALLTGRPIGPFEATTAGGAPFDQEFLKGKVTLLFFWYQSCGCYDLKKLKVLTDYFRDDPRFRLMVVTFEPQGLEVLPEKEGVPFPFLYVPTQFEVQQLNGGNGFPSWVLVDKEGIVTAVSGYQSIRDLSPVRQAIEALLQQS